MKQATLSMEEADAQMTAPGQMFEIENTVINDISYRVWKLAPGSLRTVFDLSLNHAPKDFLVYEDTRLTFDEHYRLASTLALRLREFGVEKGDRVTVASRNLPEWVVSFWGAIVAGAICVPLNAWWTTDELIYGLSDSGSSVAIVDEERYERIKNQLDELPDLRLLLVLTEKKGHAPSLDTSSKVRVEHFYDFIGPVASDAVPPAIEISPEDPATMFYTSGTTGKPKGAVGTHRNAVTNLMNLFFVGQRANIRFGPDTSDEAPVQNGFLLNIPLFHATGCLAVMSVNTAAGGKLVMTHHFDPGQALQLIQDEKITNFGGVPTIAMQIIDHPDFESTTPRAFEAFPTVELHHHPNWSRESVMRFQSVRPAMATVSLKRPRPLPSFLVPTTTPSPRAADQRYPFVTWSLFLRTTRGMNPLPIYRRVPTSLANCGSRDPTS